MNWIKVLSQDALPEGARQVVQVGEREVLLVNLKGQVYAVANRCPHMGAALAKGEVTDEGAIVCPRHRSAFDLRTGDVKEWSPWPPAVGRVLGAISREKALPVFPTRVEEGSIWIVVESDTPDHPRSEAPKT
jgi:nitrite reductase/ring-hydroxylating ferredoxin subunit